MWRYFTRHKTRRYVDVLPDLVYAYNHSYHRSIKRAPAQVNASNVLKVWKTLYGEKSQTFPKKPQFKQGDRVRISKAKRIFEKGYLPNWTTELFTISKRVPGRYPYVYKIQDDHGEELEGTFYEKELQQINKKDDVYEVEEILGYKKRRVGKKIIQEVKVRWKGYPPSFDSWILQTDLIQQLHDTNRKYWMVCVSSSVGYIMPSPTLMHHTPKKTTNPGSLKIETQ
ncbi:uncharacterized protein LOC133201624 [Saccostrea echinata]|uniref:uncharacterized protein LOC133201624 n=1 Tax=Saccostrea echinata TaxID=191078 RepID=UPI002A82044E|nr:uncharacterized protein LOC133201624 [Saccostrea echinata]